MIPGKMTADGKDAAVLLRIAKPFIDAGFNVLALGKPGVDFFSSWDPNKMFYDANLITNLTWQNLLDNAKEGVQFLRKQLSVDNDRIYVLGHSEGTQVATDLAKDTPLAGMILLAYSGEDLLTTVKWQMAGRTVDHFIKTDVDSDHDGLISKQEAAKWPANFSWDWKAGQEKVSIKEVQDAMEQDLRTKEALAAIRKIPFCASSGKCERGPVYKETASFKGPLYVFTGELDLQTPASEALKLKQVCEARKKNNCFVEIVPGVQHGFSPPRAPRRHPLLDISVGPVEPFFQEELAKLAKQLR